MSLTVQVRLTAQPTPMDFSGLGKDGTVLVCLVVCCQYSFPLNIESISTKVLWVIWKLYHLSLLLHILNTKLSH